MRGLRQPSRYRIMGREKWEVQYGRICFFDHVCFCHVDGSHSDGYHGGDRYLCMNYIFESIFLYRVSQIRNYSHGFLAWIPFLNKLRLGQIAGKKNVGILLTILDIICTACFAEMCFGPQSMADTSLNSIISILWLVTFPIVFILNIYLSHRIMKKVMPRWADLLTLANVFTAGISRSIILFLLRNRKELLAPEPGPMIS